MKTRRPCPNWAFPRQKHDNARPTRESFGSKSRKISLDSFVRSPIFGTRLLFFSTFLSLCLVCDSTLHADVRLWPVPQGEPVSQYWTVDVNGQNAGVLTARTADPPFAHYDYGGEYGFVSLDADEPIHLRIQKKIEGSPDSLTIRPQSLGLIPTRKDDGSFEITVDKPCQFSVEYNGREHPLLIFVNPLEKDIPEADENTIVYGPGIHEPQDGRITLGDNQTLYLAPGAVVHCGIEVNGQNVKICGRGIIDSSRWAWRAGPTHHVVSIEHSKNVTVEGVIIRGAAHWTVVPTNSEDVIIDGIKLCGGRVQNDDGINPCNSRRVHISRCFLRTDDDCIAIKGLDNQWGNCEDITVENCVFWCDRARIVLMGHESRAPFMRRITFRNCDIIHSQMRNFLMEPGEDMRLENILLEDIRFEMGKENAIDPALLTEKKDIENLRFDIDVDSKENWLFVGQPTVNAYMQTKVPGHIQDLTIRNISVSGPISYCGILFAGVDEDHQTKGLTIENLTLFGKKLPPDSPLIHIQNFTTDVEFR